MNAALGHLAQARLARRKPAEDVVLLLGESWRQRRWWEDGDDGLHVEIRIGAAEPVSRIDLRSLLDCSVIVVAEHHTPQLTRLFARLRPICRRVTVVVEDWLPQRVGWDWVRGGEPREMRVIESADAGGEGNGGVR